MPEMIRETEAWRDDVNNALSSPAECGLLELQKRHPESLRGSLAALSCRWLLSARQVWLSLNARRRSFVRYRQKGEKEPARAGFIEQRKNTDA
jgi:hypothetical protein